MQLAGYLFVILKNDMNKNLPNEAKMSEEHITFKRDVISGLKRDPKQLDSKYFYDEKGDRLFQSIMEMPEYYLTDCEMDIFKNKTEQLVESITAANIPFDLIELGAGDASKSAHLLKFMAEEKIDFTYMPIDISGNILTVLNNNLKQKIPSLNIKVLHGDYFKMLDKAMNLSDKRKVVLFLGGNIGNMEMDDAYTFCTLLRQKLNKGDILITGFDLKKNPHTILNAYNDARGLTASFNLNLLARINRELKADFNIANFQHYQSYDPLSGACKSYLISLIKQTVDIGEEKFNFKQNEAIYMEISQKYKQEDIDKLSSQTGFSILSQIADANNWFVDSIWQAV